MAGSQFWNIYGSVMGFVALLHSLSTLLPPELRAFLRRLFKYMSGFSRYTSFTIDEYDGAFTNQLFSYVQLHLSHSAARSASRTCLALAKNDTVSFSLAPNETLQDSFHGSLALWEFSCKERTSSSSHLHDMDDKRSFILRIRKKDRNFMLSSYVPYIIAHAKEIKLRSRIRYLYSNLKSHQYYEWGGRSRMWASVPFSHPATFETLAMDPSMKKIIVNDLLDFTKGEDFYKKAGRAWKRGYLLHGPPGTGKSSMIAAMANLLEYDVYDMELTEVKSNAQLKNLLIKTTNKSIIVIEDIDCSLDLSNRAKKGKNKKKLEDEKSIGDQDGDASEVTLSGLLNFTDGLWSCCGSERIFVFTTNHIDKLDPALLRSGRMDMHIHMSYCTFDAFKVLARNYLGLEEHELFEDVRDAMSKEGVEITRAEVSEVLTREKRNSDEALKSLVRLLRESASKRKENADEERGKVLKMGSRSKMKSEDDKEEEEKSGSEDEGEGEE